MSLDQSLLLALFTSGSYTAREGLIHEQNRSRWHRSPLTSQSPSKSSSHEITATVAASKHQRYSRESTPNVSVGPMTVILSLNQDQWPMNPHEGFVFGSGTNADIVIVPNNDCNVSRKHFTVQVQLDVNFKPILMLTVQSTRGVTIKPAQKPPKTLKPGRCVPLENEDLIIAGLASLVVWIAPAPARKATEKRRLLRRAYNAYIRQPDRPVEIPMSTELLTLQSHNQLALSHGPLGAGTFGTVYRAFDENYSEYAVKVFHSNCKVPTEIMKQITIMKDLSHKHIVKVYPSLRVAANAVTKGRSYIVMELLSGSLEALFPSTTSDMYRMPSLADTEECFRQLFGAVAYLHREGLTHRDLKPDNILIRSIKPLEVAIADFDSLGWHQPLISFFGTPKYTAPEMIIDLSKQPEGSNFYTNKVDVWSLGVMLLEYTVIGGIPVPQCREGHDWRDLPIEQLIGAYNQSVHGLIDRGDQVKEGFEELWEIARLMVLKDPLTRPAIKHCLDFVENAADDRKRAVLQDSLVEHAVPSDKNEDDESETLIDE